MTSRTDADFWGWFLLATCYDLVLLACAVVVLCLTGSRQEGFDYDLGAWILACGVGVMWCWATALSITLRNQWVIVAAVLSVGGPFVVVWVLPNLLFVLSSD